MLLNHNEAEFYYQDILEVINQEQKNPKSSCYLLHQIFERIFNNLTSAEPQAFHSLFGRIAFVQNKYPIEAETKRNIKLFKRTFEQVRTKTRNLISSADVEQLSSILALIIGNLSDTQVPEVLKYEMSIAPAEHHPEKETIYELRAVVTELGTFKTSAKGVRYFSIRCQAESSERILTIVFWDRIEDQLFKQLRLLQVNQVIQLFHLNRHKDKQDQYLANTYTRLIIEPDYLFDATDLAGCFIGQETNPNLFLLSKLMPSDNSAATLKGKIINDLLDNLINHPTADFETDFNKVLMENSLQAIVFGAETIEEIKLDIRDNHLPNLIELAKRYRGQNISLEPSFISSKHGIQGRLDALIEYPESPEIKEVFELKSGKAPSSYPPVWINHQVQVICYNLLLQANFGEDRKGASMVFYSAAKKDTLRDVPYSLNVELQILSLRNHLMSILNDLASNNLSALSNIDLKLFGQYPSYKAKEVMLLEHALKRAPKAAKWFYGRLLSFILREQQAAKTGSFLNQHADNQGHAALWRSSDVEKLSRFELIPDLHLTHFNSKESTAHFKIFDPKPHNFRIGDVAVLYPQSETGSFPLNGQLLKGSVTKLSEEELTFTFRNQQVNTAFLSQEVRWCLEHDLFESNFWLQAQSLYSFISASERKINLLLGIEEPKFNEHNVILERSLNQNQNELLAKAMAAEDYFLLQGPPGTGKTSNLVINIIKKTLETTPWNLVILAFTNKAVEEIALHLEKNNLSYLRFGGRDSNSEYVLANYTKGKSLEEVTNHIKKQRIFLGTTSAANSRLKELSQIVPLQFLMVDEASQLTDAQIIGLLPNFKKFILIGDQNQLPAVIVQNPSFLRIKDPVLNEIGIENLGQSLFERLYQNAEKKQWSHAFGMLEAHYRMHQDIADCLNTFYQNKLYFGSERQKTPFNFYNGNLNNSLAESLSKSRLIFINSEKSNFSKTHPIEAQQVANIAKLIAQIKGEDLNAISIGIISPWRAQVAMIKNALSPELRELVMVDTVERFQGSERDFIIVSFALSNHLQLGAMQSLNHNQTLDRKLLVTLSRAKEQVIFIGNEEILKKSNIYEEVLGKFTNVASNKFGFT